MNLQDALERAKAEKKTSDAKSDEPKAQPKEEIQTERLLIESYGDVRIYKEPGEPLYVYEIPTPRLKGEERGLINTLLEIATGVISDSETKNITKEEKKAKFLQKILEIIANTPELKIPIHAKQFYAEAVVKEMAGYGIIDPLIDDDFLEEIMIIGPGRPIYVFHRKYEMMKTNIVFYEDRDIFNLIDKMARTVGRRIDIQSPLLDARLPDGSRVNATILPASIDGSTVTLRKFRKDPFTVVDLIKYGTFDFDVAAFLWVVADGYGAYPANILISGGTASGKTSTLNVLASFIPTDERVISIEDTAELALPLQHWIRMETRPASVEGSGEISMDTLVKNSLRMRPDRIIVGEIRGAEGFTLFTAMNTGHRGAIGGNSKIQLANGNIEKISDIAKRFIKDGSKNEDGFEFAQIKDELRAVSFNKKTLELESKQITRIWRKKTNEKMAKISFKSGKSISLTLDHPVYRIFEGVQEVAAGDVKTGDYLAFPRQLELEASNEKLFSPYLTGMIYGDGNITGKSIGFVNAFPPLVRGFESEISKVSGHKITQVKNENFEWAQVWDPALCGKIQEEYGIPFGRKAKIFELNEKLLTSGNEEMGKFLRGMYDCNGWANLHSNSVCLSTSNPSFAKTVPLLLLRFGIVSSTYTAKQDGKGNLGPYFAINIYGRENLEKFRDHIGFAHELKSSNLEAAIENSGDAYDVLPNLSRTLKNARMEAQISQAQLAKRLGNNSRGVVEAFETGSRKSTRKMVDRVCGAIENKITKQLKMLVDSPIRWDEVDCVEILEHDGYVYDLTVEDNHTYIANEMIVSNCYGTVHANSAHETLIRLMSPPISVPSIMIGALNFILMQNRLHDRRKGVIRRVTEIAEVSNDENEMPKLAIIYQWDSAKDKLQPTGIPSNFVNTLATFTGLRKEDIYDEIENRKKVLMDLSTRGVRKIEDVCKITQNYVLQKRGKI
ncbi:Flp pilus assembly complex ATPase component TadA [Candidatus Micrarchaeota archaeon]|nr:Flp pilus assembly complex ATPase component TadA [Candidatus Micrarchaeota archaeon]